MKRLLLSSVVAATLGVAAAGAQATTVGTVPGGGDPNNQVINPLTLIEGWYGANLYLIGGPADITATLIGYEAGFTNTFVWGANTLVGGGGTLGTLGAPIGTSFLLTNVASGLLGFSFDTSGPDAGDVANGSNVEPNQGQGNFFVTLSNCADVACIDTTNNGSTAGGGQVAWLFFDDLGAGPDDNHDDLVVRLQITNGGGFQVVPEPGSLALIGAALFGLGAVRRRRQT